MKHLFVLSLAIIFAGHASNVEAESIDILNKDRRERAVLYEEDGSSPQGHRYFGSVTWTTQIMPPNSNRPPEFAISAEIEIPERQMKATWLLRQNNDPTLPASHTIEVYFKLPPKSQSGGVQNMAGLLMKEAEQSRGTPLAGLAVEVTSNYFLVGLSQVDSDKRNNLKLLKDGTWIDIPIVYKNHRRGILAVEKGPSGEAAFAEALQVWGSGHVPQTSDIILRSQIGAEVAATKIEKDNEEAPLGLKWGSTKHDIDLQNAELESFPQKDFGESYLARKLTRALSDQETAILSFGYEDKLFRIVVISRGYENDPSGSSIQRRYSELVSLLAEKYGKPISVHSLGDSIYRESQYFLAGINGGQTRWYSDYETPQLNIQLALVADSSSKGRWRIIFESKPLKKAFNALRRTKEKGAL